MSIIIKAEKIKTVDGPKYKIISFEALKQHELPKRYLKELPNMYKLYNTDSRLAVHTNNRNTYMKAGDIYSAEDLEALLKDVGLCGERLRNINDEIRKECEGWQGEIEWRI